MFLNRKHFKSVFFALGIAMLAILASCATPPPPKALTMSEQIVADSHKAQELILDFQKKVTRANLPEVQAYLTQLAQSIAKQEPGFEIQSLEVRIHQDPADQLKRIFAFPGTTLSIPLSFLEKVEYENELAAGIAYELAQVIHRQLAKKLDSTALVAAPVVQAAKSTGAADGKEVEGVSTPPVELFGSGSVFNFERDDRAKAISTATELLYRAKIDPRGMPSFFQRYSGYLSGEWNPDSVIEKKEVEFNLKEAHKAKSSYLPLRDPVVRSADFIMMKKRISK